MQYLGVKTVLLSWALLPWDVKLKNTLCIAIYRMLVGPIASIQGEVSGIKKPLCLFLELGF